MPPHDLSPPLALVINKILRFFKYLLIDYPILDTLQEPRKGHILYRLSHLLMRVKLVDNLYYSPLLGFHKEKCGKIKDVKVKTNSKGYSYVNHGTKRLYLSKINYDLGAMEADLCLIYCDAMQRGLVPSLSL